VLQRASSQVAVVAEGGQATDNDSLAYLEKRRGPWAPVFMDRWGNAKLFILQKELRLNEVETAFGRWCQLDRFVRLHHPDGGFPLNDTSIRQFASMAAWPTSRVRQFFTACLKANILEQRGEFPSHWVLKPGQDVKDYVFVHGYERAQLPLLQSTEAKRQRERARSAFRRNALKGAPNEGPRPPNPPPPAPLPGGTSPPYIHQIPSKNGELKKNDRRSTGGIQIQVHLQEALTNQPESTYVEAPTCPLGLVGKKKWTEAAEQAWKAVEEDLRAEGKGQSFREDTAPVRVDGDTLVIACEDRFRRAWCEEHLTDWAMQALVESPQTAKNGPWSVCFIEDPETLQAWRSDAAERRQEALKQIWTPEHFSEVAEAMRLGTPAERCPDAPKRDRLVFALAWARERGLPFEALVQGYRTFLRDAYWGMQGRGWATNLFCTAGVLSAKLGRLTPPAMRAMGG